MTNCSFKTIYESIPDHGWISTLFIFFLQLVFLHFHPLTIVLYSDFLFSLSDVYTPLLYFTPRHLFLICYEYLQNITRIFIIYLQSINWIYNYDFIPFYHITFANNIRSFAIFTWNLKSGFSIGEEEISIAWGKNKKKRRR